MKTPRRFHRRDDRGVVAIEFVLVAPILFALIFAIADFGVWFSKYVQVTGDARDVARSIALGGPSWTPPASLPSGATIKSYTTCPTNNRILEEARTLTPDLVLLDRQLAGVGYGYDLIRPLTATGATVVVLTGVTERIQLAMCLEAGAAGVLNKAGSFTALLEQVERAASGQAVTPVTVRAAYAEELRQHRAAERARTAPFEALSRRESQVLGMILDGMSARDMAQESYVSLATVRTQIRSMFQKLGVNSQLEAAAVARAWGWSPPGR